MSNLKTTSCFSFLSLVVTLACRLQLLVRATYQGVRTQQAQAYVNVTVKRNENQPQFTQGEYRREILENFPLGESILQVSATDKDQGVSRARTHAHTHVRSRTHTCITQTQNRTRTRWIVPGVFSRCYCDNQP